MLARQIEELNIHTDPTLSRAKVNSITHDCPALTLYAALALFLLEHPPPLASFHSAPSELYPPPIVSLPVIRVSHLRRSPGAVRPILRLLVRKYGSTWWSLARRIEGIEVTRENPLLFLRIDPPLRAINVSALERKGGSCDIPPLASS